MLPRGGQRLGTFETGHAIIRKDQIETTLLQRGSIVFSVADWDQFALGPFPGQGAAQQFCVGGVVLQQQEPLRRFHIVINGFLNLA